MPELWMKTNKVLTFKEEGGVATSILKIDNPELLPLCMSVDCTVEKFNEWLTKRANLTTFHKNYSQTPLLF